MDIGDFDWPLNGTFVGYDHHSESSQEGFRVAERSIRTESK